MHTLNGTINFFDCDPAGILFFGRVFELCHSAYEDLIKSFNLGFDYWNNDKYVVPIIHTEADYLLPLKPGEKYLIEVSVSKLKESSFELNYLCKNENGKITNEVKTVHVFVDRIKWKKSHLLPELMEGLSKHLK